MDTYNNIFLSPVSKKQLHFENNYLITPNKEETYPIVEGIPILIPNYEEHLSKINQWKCSIKSSWYKDGHVRYYDQGPYKYHIKRRKKVVQGIINEFISSIEKSNNMLKIIDLGCGDGASSRWLIDALPDNAQVFFTDYNFERLLKAKILLGSDMRFIYFVSDIVNPPLQSGYFDLIFSNHVIEHIGNDDLFLRNAHKILRKERLFLLGCPNEGVFWWLLSNALSPESIRKTDHLHFYNDQVLIEKGRFVGFTHQDTVHLGYGLPHWRLDAFLRKYKIIDDILHMIGSKIIKKQASSLYLTFKK